MDSKSHGQEYNLSGVCFVCWQSLWKSKKLIRDAEREMLHAVNTRECEVLVERWQSEECMNAIMKFFQKSWQNTDVA